MINAKFSDTGRRHISFHHAARYARTASRGEMMSSIEIPDQIAHQSHIGIHTASESKEL